MPAPPRPRAPRTFLRLSLWRLPERDFPRPSPTLARLLYPPVMKISESKNGAWTLLALSGKIDHSGADELERVLLPHLTGQPVALDFTGVDFITSSGFRVLMRAEREQDARKGRLLLGNLRDPVRQVFDTAGLSQYFKIVTDVRSPSLAQ